MITRIVVILSTILFASLILVISILRTASVRFTFSEPSPKPEFSQGEDIIQKSEINYTLPPTGNVLPDSPLWILKMAKDRLWMSLLTNQEKKTELKLLFADKRLAIAGKLFEKKDANLGYATLVKAEMYLDEASLAEIESRHKGANTDEFLIKIANASLKHRQVISEILSTAPEDAKPKIIELEKISIKAFQTAKDVISQRGLILPKSPFEGY